jgi:hypothetical protein
VAKGNGAWISDSEQSLPIEFTVQAQNSEEEKSGCGSFIADGSLLLVAAAVGFVAIAKKRKQDE